MAPSVALEGDTSPQAKAIFAPAVGAALNWLMALPERDLAVIRNWLGAHNDRVPEDVRPLLRYEMDVTNTSVTVLECRPPWREGLGPEWTRHVFARLRYTKTTGDWSLYWADRNSKFHIYDLVPPTDHIRRLLREIDDDPTAIFWG